MNFHYIQVALFRQELAWPAFHLQLTNDVYSDFDSISHRGRHFMSVSQFCVIFLLELPCHNRKAAQTKINSLRLIWFAIYYFRKEQIEDGKLLLNCHHYFVQAEYGRANENHSKASLLLISDHIVLLYMYCRANISRRFVSRCGKNTRYPENMVAIEKSSIWAAMRTARGYRSNSKTRESLANAEKGRQEVHYII